MEQSKYTWASAVAVLPAWDGSGLSDPLRICPAQQRVILGLCPSSATLPSLPVSRRAWWHHLVRGLSAPCDSREWWHPAGSSSGSQGRVHRAAQSSVQEKERSRMWRTRLSNANVHPHGCVISHEQTEPSLELQTPSFCCFPWLFPCL